MAKKKILVIDDDPEFRSSLVLALNEAGYETITADDGAAGLQIANSSADIYAVILDLAMPRVGGFQVLVDLKMKGKRPLVLAITSAYGDQHLDVATYLGANTSMRKPEPGKSLSPIVRALAGLKNQT